MAADHLTRADRKQSEAHWMVHLLSDRLNGIESRDHHRERRHQHQRVVPRQAPSSETPATTPSTQTRTTRTNGQRRKLRQSRIQTAPRDPPDAAMPQPRTPPRKLGGELPAEQDDRPQVLRGDRKTKLRRQPRAPPGSVERDTAKPGEPKHRRQRSDAKTRSGKTERVTGAMHRPERKLSEHGRRRAHPPAGQIRDRPADDQHAEQPDRGYDACRRPEAISAAANAQTATAAPNTPPNKSHCAVGPGKRRNAKFPAITPATRPTNPAVRSRRTATGATPPRDRSVRAGHAGHPPPRAPTDRP